MLADWVGGGSGWLGSLAGLNASSLSAFPID